MAHLWKTISVGMAGALASSLKKLTVAEIEMVGKHAFMHTKGRAGESLSVFSSAIRDLAHSAPNNVSDAGEEALLERLKHLPLKVMFDVGANTGEWVNAALRHFPGAEVHCFEIVPETFSKLVQGVGTGNDSVKLNAFGLSDSNGEVDVYLGDTDYISSVYTFDWEPAGAPVQCRVVRGDDYAREQGVEAVDVLKIDVEGAEGAVLRGLGQMLDRRAVRVIQFEYNRGAIESKFLLKDFYDLLVPLGYVVGKLTPMGVMFRDYAYVYEDFNGPNYLSCLASDNEVIEAVRVRA